MLQILEANGHLGHDDEETYSGEKLLHHVESLEEGALFSKWRPKAHIIAPNSWMNDPMSMFVKRSKDGTSMYHISYQYYHGHTQWGPPSQATAISRDGVHWEDAGDCHNASVLEPGATRHDVKGIYDGTILPGLTFKGGIAQIYTAVSHLPMGWTLPYHPGTEKQCLAYSLDDGQSWIAHDGPPVIPHPPRDLDITGFRDPFIFYSTSLDELTARPEHNSTADTFTIFASERPIYLAVSGGDRGTGSPVVMLYRNSPGTILSWEYLGTVGDLPGGVKLNEWSANTGHNYECANLIRLRESGDGTDFSRSTGIEILFGGTQDKAAFGQNFWTGGRWIRNDMSGAISLASTVHGCMDWGDSYAAMSFRDQDRRLCISWAPETDSKFAWRQRGWSGSLTVLKELFLKRTQNVMPHDDQAGSWTLEKGSTIDALTMGSRIATEVLTEFTRREKQVEQTSSQQYLIRARYGFAKRDGRIEIGVLATPDRTEETLITYDISREELVIHRSKSSIVTPLNGSDIIAKHRVWSIAESGIEDLKLDILIDGSLGQIIANESTVVTFRAYPWHDEACQVTRYQTAGIAEKSFIIYEGLTDAWKARPKDTRVPLIQEENVPWDGY